jgi:uncharacterized protein YutE (UPF0331/DUF86 family)
MYKTLKRFLGEHGATPGLPKDVVRSACSAKMLNEKLASTLLRIIDDRNGLVHDYSEKYAEILFERIKKNYAVSLRELSNILLRLS